MIESLTGARPRTRVRVCYDDRALYLAVECWLVEGSPPVGRVRPRDQGAWRDDCIEVWITPRRDAPRYQFIVSCRNSIYDAIRRGAGDVPSYDPQWSHAVKLSTDRWTVELGIPLRALQLERWPRVLRFNIGRNGPQLAPHSWNLPYGDTSASALILEGTTEGTLETKKPEQQGKLPPTAAIAGGSLQMSFERRYARAGERWIEGRLYVQPPSGQLKRVQLKATLFDIPTGKEVAEASTCLHGGAVC